MNAIGTTIRSLFPAPGRPSLLAVFALALTLLAIPTFSPESADARVRSEGQVNRLCANAGGELYYDFFHYGYDGFSYVDYSMTCTLPSGNSFWCFADGAGFFCV
jgi:hypothetical protein